MDNPNTLDRSSLTPFHKTALAYADRGWLILPIHTMVAGLCDCSQMNCHSPGKHPRPRDGLKSASKDPAQIEAWANSFLHANIGIRTGPESGVLVLDVDIGADGSESLAQLIAEHGPLPPTVQARTGSGGSHYLFKYPASKMTNRAGFRPGLDVRGANGYIVAPPSNHKSGGVYEWVEDCGPGQIELADVPEWLVKIISSPKSASTPRAAALPVNTPVSNMAVASANSLGRDALMAKATAYAASVSPAIEGERNSKAFNLAGHLSAFQIRGTDEGLDPEDVLSVMKQWNARNPVPLDAEELAQATKSAMANGEPRAPKWEDLPPQTAAPDKSSRAGRLSQLESSLKLFRHEKDRNVSFVDVIVDGHRETMSVNGRHFDAWLRSSYYWLHHEAIPATTLKDLVATLHCRGITGTMTSPTALRVAAHEDVVYVDLCRDDWRCVRIDASDWRVIESKDCPVHFYRTQGMRELPEPTPGGSINALRRLINVENQDSWILLVSWLVGCLMPTGAYPILAICGEHGSCKSTATTLLHELIDPSKASLRSEPGSARDLMIAAQNNFVLSFDNVSHLPRWLSDGFCRLATGAGFASRELYANTEETLIEARRPVMLNGIEELTTAADLADRTLMVSLASLTGPRKTDEDVKAEYRAAQPSILGALYDAVSVALARRQSVSRKDLPRMADFAVWANAAEPGLGLPPGSFNAAMKSNRDETDAVVADSSLIWTPLMSFMSDKLRWDGTSTELLKGLNSPGKVPEEIRRSKYWPNTARGMAAALTRLIPVLKRNGFEVIKDKNERPRKIHIRNLNELALVPARSPLAIKTAA